MVDVARVLRSAAPTARWTLDRSAWMARRWLSRGDGAVQEMKAK
jgi:hypothetical protein